MRAALFARAAKHTTEDPKDHRVHVTGDVLHLVAWAADPPGTALLYGTGRYVPVCGGNGHPVEVWQRTGPGYTGWEGHAHWPVCRRCIRALLALRYQADDQVAAHERHVAVTA